MTDHTQREALIKKLIKLGVFVTRDHAEVVADFIIKDRCRVVEPLVKHKKLWCGNWKEYTASQAIDETLANAGLTTKGNV